MANERANYINALSHFINANLTFHMRCKNCSRKPCSSGSRRDRDSSEEEREANANKSGVSLLMFSDEILLHIFSFTSQKTLCTLARVCKRFRNLTLDESLWQRLEVGGTVLFTDSLAYMLSRGPRILRLATSVIEDPIIADAGDLMKTHTCKLEYLDLSNAYITTSSLKVLMNLCRSLKKLSLEGCEVTNEVLYELRNNKDLVTLDLAMCQGLKPRGLKSLLSHCTKLEDINLAWCNLSSECMSVICHNLSKNIKRINLSGTLANLSSDNVKVLLMRCKDIIELDLSDSISVCSKIIDSILTLPKIEVLSLSRCYKLPLAQLAKLKNLEHLKRLNIFGNNMFSLVHLNTLKQIFHNIAFNEDILSTIARPTVGIRRTSIWGMRCRDIHY